jgi:type II secretory pathway predicted ATPase ExeA
MARYNSYFGFLESPFENKLDQKFLFLSDDHTEVLAALLYFIKDEIGFAIFCGDVGTGKSMLINSFLDRLPKSVKPIIISHPKVVYLEILRHIASTLQIKATDKNVLELIGEVKQALITARREGIVYLLIVDEAHLLSDATLEDIRLLSNIETREHKLLQILLAGQYELSHKLDRPEMRQLRQRINVSRFLSPLTAVETVQYIDHRLKKVGADFDYCFEANCQSLIFKLTDGVPRRINQLCDGALLICMAKGEKRVNRKILKEASEALITDLIFTPRSSDWKGFLLPGKLTKFIPPAIAGIVLLLMAGMWGYSTFFDHRNVQTSAAASPPRETRSAALMVPQDLQGFLFENRDKPISTPASPSQKAKLASPPVSQNQKKLARQLVVKQGDYIGKIAAQWYPENVDLGMEAIILANLKYSQENLLQPGQVLYMPRLNFAKKTMQMRDGLFYGLYARYRSFESLQQAMPRLNQSGVRYLILKSVDYHGTTVHRVILGGYEKEQDLGSALKRLEAKSRWFGVR